MLFELGDQVRIKKLNKVGEVRAYRHEHTFVKDTITENHKYFVKYGQYFIEWFDEKELERINFFDNKFELGLLDLLIDVNLLFKNYDIVEYLHKEKQKYLKGSV